MAGLRGNVAWAMVQKQVSKGTAATYAAASAYKLPLSGTGRPGPNRATDNLSETDASRDRGVTYVQNAGVEGTMETYVRDAPIGFLLWAALGADAVTGTTNYVHTLTGANSLPYFTTWTDVGDTLYEQLLDCKLGTLTISGEAGGPLSASAAIRG